MTLSKPKDHIEGNANIALTSDHGDETVGKTQNIAQEQQKL